jgi:hypothetical protein
LPSLRRRSLLSFVLAAVPARLTMRYTRGMRNSKLAHSVFVVLVAALAYAILAAVGASGIGGIAALAIVIFGLIAVWF